MDLPDPIEVPAFDLPAWGEDGAPAFADAGGPGRTSDTGEAAGIEPDGIVVTTTDGLEGARIRRYLGVVAGEASVSIGDRGAAAALREARALAMDLMRSEAVGQQAGAVIGVRLDVVIRKGDVLALVTGTAVQVSPH